MGSWSWSSGCALRSRRTRATSGSCLGLAKKSGALHTYLQTGLDLLDMCSGAENMTTTDTAYAVALVGQGVDLHAKDSDGYTPLHYACRCGHAEVVKALLEKGADVHPKDSVGETPLYLACEEGHQGIAAMLQKKGAVE